MSTANERTVEGDEGSRRSGKQTRMKNFSGGRWHLSACTLESNNNQASGMRTYRVGEKRGVR